MTIDNDELMRLLDRRNTEIKQNSEVVKSIQAEERRTSVDVIKSMEAAKDNSVLMQQGELLRQQKTAQNNFAAASAVGTNMNDSTEAITNYGKALRVAADNSIQAAKRVESNVNARFLDDPINWVAAQFDLEPSVKSAEAASITAQTISKRVTELQSFTQQAVQTNNALGAVKSTVELDATLNRTRDLLDADIGKQRLLSLGMDKRGIAELDSMSQQELINAQTGENIKNDRARMQMAREQFAQQKTMNNLAIEDRMLRLQKDQLAEQDKQTMMKVFVDGAAVLGKDLSGVPANKLEMMMKFNPESKDYLRVGLNTLTTNHPVISDSAGESGMMIMNTSAPLAPHQAALKDWLVSSVQRAAGGEIIKSPDGKQVLTDRSDVKGVSSAASYLAVTGAGAQQSNIKFGDATNIYKAPPLPVIAAIPDIANSAFGQKVLAPALASGVLQDFNPDQIKSMVIKAIKDKTLTYQEAIVGGNSMFAAVPAHNNRYMNYKGFGLPNQEGYKTEVAGATAMGFKAVVNLADAKEFQRWIDRQLAAAAQHSMQTQPQVQSAPGNIMGRF